MIIQEIFTNFLAVDTLTIDNLETIENFCYDKFLLEATDPGQSNISKLELSTLLSSIKQQIEKNLEEIKVNFNFKDSVKFTIGRTWINLNQNSNIVRPHLHANSLLSGVLYLKCNNSGPLVFIHPVMAQQYVINSELVDKFNGFNSSVMTVDPAVGKLIIFPSWLVHYVEKNLDDSDRISLAFNIDIQEN
jgi:uncharacterized protein (TIGR02466 family)